MADFSSNREASVFMAKLAGDAKCYDVMIKEITDMAKAVAKEGKKLTTEEIHLVITAYINTIGPLIRSCKIVSNCKSESNEIAERIIEFKKKIQEEISNICEDFLDIIVPLSSIFKTEQHEQPLIWTIEKHEKHEQHVDHVLIFTMIGDYHRLLAENAVFEENGDSYFVESSRKSRDAYMEALHSAQRELLPIDSALLCAALNLASFYNDIDQDPIQACEVAQTAVLGAKDMLEICKDSQSILKTLQDNIKLWEAKNA